MIYPDVQDFTTEDLKILCDAYRKNNFIDPETSEKLGVKRGLRNSDGTGVLAGLTNICDVIGYEKDGDKIIPIDGKLIYRGIDLNDIVNEAITKDRFLFEEVFKPEHLSELYQVQRYKLCRGDVVENEDAVAQQVDEPSEPEVGVRQVEDIFAEENKQRQH